MVYPIGLEAASQRIQEIRERFDALENPSPSEPQNASEANNFQGILNSQLQAGTPSSVPNQSNLETMIESQAQQAGVDSSLVKAVVKAESGFNPNAVSKVGAQGLMQLMPSTAQSLGVQSSLNPVDNVQGGTQYLKTLITKYHSIPNALAAYNAGPGAVDKYGGIPPYPETQNYVHRVMDYQQHYAQQDKQPGE